MPAHSPSLLDILVHTPLWVWALYAFVIFMGFQRARDRVVSIWRILLLPVVMGLLALSGIVNAGLGSLPAILVGLVAGGVGGWLMEREGATRRLPDGRAFLRGEWWTFLQVLVILVFRYITSVVGAVNPMLNADPTWHTTTVLISAGLSALFLGRAAARLRVHFTATPSAA
jgi:hypothetical protein